MSENKWIAVIVGASCAIVIGLFAWTAKADTLPVRGAESVVQEPATPGQFGGVHVGLGAVWTSGESDVELTESGTQFDDVKDTFDFDNAGIRASILAQRHLGGTAWVGGIEVGGSYTEDLTDIFIHLRLGAAMGNLMPYALVGVGADLIDAKFGGQALTNDLFTVEDVQYNFRAGTGVQWKMTEYLSLDVQYAHIWGVGSEINLQDQNDAVKVEFDSERDEVSAQLRLKLN